MTNQAEVENQDNSQDVHYVYHMAVVETTYEKEVKGKFKTESKKFNILVKLAEPAINQPVINNIQNHAVQRTIAEESVLKNNIKTVVIMCIFPLGLMTENHYLGVPFTPEPHEDTAEPETEE